VYLPAIDFPRVDNVPNWKDINPRVGVSYDLFGNGKTAIKASLGRYIKPETTDIANRNNPAATIAVQTSRNWNDSLFGAGDARTGNYVPDCDLTSRFENGECGPMDNRAFGTSVITTRFSPDVTEGWFVRPSNWQTSIAVQHELRPGIGVNVGYFRTWWHNGGPGSGDFHVTDNLAVTPADFDTYCITAPSDARLPGGGGYQVCGLYDVKPGLFGRVDNLIIDVNDVGGRTQIYNGIELSMNARFGRGGVVQGGIGMGRTLVDTCNTPDVPAQFCRSTLPFKGETQIKVSGSYPLPWFGLLVSGALQNLSGRPISASHVVPNSQIAPVLGRNLSQCGSATTTCTASVTVNLIEPNTMFEDRYTLLDMRLGKTFRLGNVRVMPRLDVYNVFNSDAVNSMITRYGTSWLRPQEIFAARMLKLGAQVDF
jgi:hypothetical protein